MDLDPCPPCTPGHCAGHLHRRSRALGRRRTGRTRRAGTHHPAQQIPGPRPMTAELPPESGSLSYELAGSTARRMRMTVIYRYARGARSDLSVIDGRPNYHHITAAVDGTRVLLESGINRVRTVAAVDG